MRVCFSLAVLTFLLTHKHTPKQAGSALPASCGHSPVPHTAASATRVPLSTATPIATAPAATRASSPAACTVTLAVAVCLRRATRARRRCVRRPVAVSSAVTPLTRSRSAHGAGGTWQRLRRCAHGRSHAHPRSSAHKEGRCRWRLLAVVKSSGWRWVQPATTKESAVRAMASGAMQGAKPRDTNRGESEQRTGPRGREGLCGCDSLLLFGFYSGF